MRKIVEDSTDIIRVRETAMLMMIMSETISDDFSKAVLFALKHDKGKSRQQRIGGLNAATKYNYNSDEIGDELIAFLNHDDVFFTVDALRALTINKMVKKVPNSILVNFLTGLKGGNRVIHAIEAIKSMDVLEENLEALIKEIYNNQSYREYTRNIAKDTLLKFGKEID